MAREAHQRVQAEIPLLAARGISQETADAFHVEMTVEGEIKFPYPQGVKLRREQDGKRTFRWEPGSTQTIYHRPGQVDSYHDVAFLVEGETDTMRLWQEIGESVDVVGIPGIESWKPEWADMFDRTSRVYVVLDNDTDPYVKARVEAAYDEIQRALGNRVRRVRLPSGVKDICEYFQEHSRDDFRELLKNPVSRYTPLDFHEMNKPREIDWMVENLIPAGSINILFGNPYVGKSILSQSLATAVVKRQPTWLGLPLKRHGKVLYVDEENPEQDVFRRLHRMGIRPEDAPNFRYLLDQDIRLDRDPGALLEEAEVYRPDLIVIDSLTRVHTKDENSAGDMSALFNDGIKPLSRKTGATVLILHHANKVDASESNAYQRMRGSIDIGGSADTSIEASMMNAPGWVVVNQFKLRGGIPHKPIPVRFIDMDDGSLVVATTAEVPLPM